MKSKKSQGYILISVLVVLLTVLAAIVSVNTSYTKSILADEETDSVARKEIEKSALAHLHAYAEQNNCGADPANITVSGEKENYGYTLSWTKGPTGTALSGSYTTLDSVPSTWETKDSHTDVYGSTQSTSWVLASYFSDLAEVKYGRPNHHHDHSNHDIVKIDKEKNIVLRSLKLGPLRREPISLVSAELQLITTNLPKNMDDLKLQAIKYPWDPEDVTFSYDGLGTKTPWPEPLYEKFEALDANKSYANGTVKIDATGLLQSWIDGSRPNYGFALLSTGTDYSWITKPLDDNFETRPRVNLEYRCACGEACVGIKQNEAVVLGTLSSVDGYGGTTDELAKLWLHRSNEDYLDPKIPSSEEFGRTVYEPAGLSSFDITNASLSAPVIGIHVEPANPEHPDYHHYILMRGVPARSNDWLPTSWWTRIYYLQSPSDKPIGQSLEERTLSTVPYKTAPQQYARDFIPGFHFYIFTGGFSFYDDRYWFATNFWGRNYLQDYPVEIDSSNSRVHNPDASTPQISFGFIDFNTLHTPHSLHVIDQNNFLLNGMRYANTGVYTANFGRLRSYDGDIVLYNAVTKKARIIDGEISRSLSNNISAIGLYEQPIPPAGSTDALYKETLPTLFE